MAYLEWHLIQYTENMRRREPRNIGLAATDGQDWFVRLVAVDEQTGKIQGKKLRKFGLLKDDYAQWVQYYLAMFADDAMDQIRTSQRHRPGEFRVIRGGYTELHGSPQELVSHLFSDLVQDDEANETEDWSKQLRVGVESTLRIADLSPTAEIAVPVSWGRGMRDTVDFDYSLVNGQTHLMDRLQLHRRSVDEAKMVARDFNARATAARRARAANSFIAFYSQKAVDSFGTDAMLTPLWQVAATVDVDRPARAADELLQVLHSVK